MVIPIFLAVPATIRIALSILFVFKSGNFTFAISSNCAVVIEPTVTLFGSPAPFAMFAAFVNKTEAGGVFKINE